VGISLLVPGAKLHRREEVAIEKEKAAAGVPPSIWHEYQN
jgi:hypothetical protein